MADDKFPETFPLTDEVKQTIVEYLRRRNETDPAEEWCLPMELARYRVGVAVLQAMNLSTAPMAPEVEKAAPAIVGPPRLRHPIPFIVRAKVMARDHFQCLVCKSQNQLSIDHIIPLARGGSDDEDNLQTLCLSCNVKKGTW